MHDRIDIAIIGAGAAGLAAGIFAAEAAQRRGTGTFSGENEPVPKMRIVLLDGAKSIGAKILVSGGGRCNVTHDTISPRDFTPSTPAVRNILAAFSAQAARDWFASMGVALKREETGKL
ncbi:MAG: NAD(P)/FAD-dependent oxidoreductase, partial [Nitrospirales bacterium]|nr:NAD(P)/FAD-dependent oxidoreductase [Nitrospirales bacterium]